MTEKLIDGNMETLITDDFQIFIKPVGARCNLRCSYCYYIKNSDIYNSSGVNSVMDDETLENCIKQLFSVSSGDAVLFTWHGGEPLLAGLISIKRLYAFKKNMFRKGNDF